LSAQDKSASLATVNASLESGDLPPVAGGECLFLGPQPVPLQLIKDRRARRYVLRVRRDGSVRVTVPRGGSLSYAREFARKNSSWLQHQLAKQAAQRQVPNNWAPGMEILFRGQRVILDLRCEGNISLVQFGDQSIPLPAAVVDLKAAVVLHLWSLAEKELVPRTWEMAAQHQLTARRVVVRNQRSRWGSCSAKGTISLNWRLIQAPAFVRDYLILHELMHLREMNHSPRFWRCLETVCPDYCQAESWLDQHAHLLRDDPTVFPHDCGRDPH
jgi:predicted metal-dependent hydrolase